ncbi:hypothetical protein AVEN_100902-1 [Araneus ventricosus]|uniref:Uncharacterized protein n=1 Tax=Araneus ventricosus TaxID=182803 RepID=A0A4Y2AWD6_ARAVE|nr:hypothetical protein AVEN_100902-1 [Araneus ventricosus]
MTRVHRASQIAILVCRNLVPQNCKLATNLTRQECKFETTYCKRVSHHKSNLTQACCVKLIANTQSTNKASIRSRDTTHPKPVALTIQPARLREEKIDCANRSRIQFILNSS